MMDRRYMVAQWLGKVEGKYGAFHVYQSGDPRYVIFRPLMPDGKCEGTIDILIARANLKIRLPRP